MFCLCISIKLYNFAGNYAREQCRGTECQCTDPHTGETTNDSKFRPGSHWCDDSGAPRPITLCKSQSLLECDSEGNFAQAQCNTQICFCVYIDTGSVRENTESIFFPGQCNLNALVNFLFISGFRCSILLLRLYHSIGRDCLYRANSGIKTVLGNKAAIQLAEPLKIAITKISQNPFN